MLSLKTVYNHFASSRHSNWVMVPENAERLYRFVRENDIKQILDLGTGIGISASVCALAFKDKGVEGARIHTVEQSEKCIKLAQKYIPEELLSLIEFHLIEPTIWESKDIPYHFFSIYKELPEQPEEGWDLIIVDGSGPFVIESNDEPRKVGEKKNLSQGILPQEYREIQE